MQDSLFTWQGRFPYDQLKRFEITPTSTITEINDTGFDLLDDGTEQERAAWDQLRVVRRRLFFDFFFYQLEDEQWPDIPSLHEE